MRTVVAVSLLSIALAGCSSDGGDSTTDGTAAAGGQAGGNAGGETGLGGASAGGTAGKNGGGIGGAAAGGHAGADAGAGGVVAGGAAGTSAAGGKAGASGGSGQSGHGGASGSSGQSGHGGASAGGGQGGQGGQATAGNGGAAGSGGATDPPDPPGTWRSVLYPKGWIPVHEGGKPDGSGRVLPDFSHAGYHRGEVHPPYGQGTAVSTVDAAAGDGKTNATAAIQKAIDAACTKGGGVVHLPAGTYRVKLPSDTATTVIGMPCSHLVLRGDGPTKSMILFDDPTRLRDKSVIAIGKPGASLWDNGSTKTLALTADAPAGTRTVTVGSASTLAVGDWVVVRNDTTAAFRAEHRMDQAQNGDTADWWVQAAGGFRGLIYPRRIVAIQGGEIALDAPTRYDLKTRDAARVYALPATYIEETGLESLGIGAVQNTTGPSGGTEASHDNDYTTPGTTGYEVHASRFVDVGALREGWIHDVQSFSPPENASTGVHVLSNGIQFSQSAFRITVEASQLGRAEYRGGGGNGYLFHVQGNDLLFVSDRATDARHGFVINQASSGNVFVRDDIVTSRLTDDSHRFLSQANLYDSVQLDGGWLSAVNRGNTSSGAGFTATSHVFWNTQVVKNHPTAMGCAIETAQWSWGYAIGTTAPSGQSAKVCTAAVTNSYWASLDQGDPVDFVEGEGMGATLFPPSLYDSQRARRCAVEAIACDP